MPTVVALGNNGHTGPELVFTAIKGISDDTVGLCLQFHTAGEEARCSAYSAITMQVQVGDVVLLPSHRVDPGQEVAQGDPVYPRKRPLNGEGVCYFLVGATGVEPVSDADKALMGRSKRRDLMALNDAFMASSWFTLPITVDKHWAVERFHD